MDNDHFGGDSIGGSRCTAAERGKDNALACTLRMAGIVDEFGFLLPANPVRDLRRFKVNVEA
jgi:hypothetical protein